MLAPYSHGMMGRTPNIDRIAKEGILFTDHYGQPSCTAGLAAFIMGQFPIRTGMTTMKKALEEAQRKMETPHGSN